jgi:hypothetical protein
MTARFGHRSGGPRAPAPSYGRRAESRGVRVPEVRRLLLALPGVTEGRSYGLPSFLLKGRFLARFRDGDTVLVLQLATIMERDILMQMDANAFFFTEHYRDYPAVLIRLSEVPRALLTTVVTDSWHHVTSRPARRPRRR